jgi:trimeric autotransporter adhesin
MQTHITPNNRLASLGTIGLLFLAGIAGMVFLLPVNSAHAATPTVSLSTLSSGVLTSVTSATVGSTLVISGSGFGPAKTVTITTAVGTATVAWLTNGGGCATTNGGTSGTDSLVVSGCLTTTAAGTFRVSVAVPNLPGGANTISVSDGTSTGTAALVVTSKISISYTGNNFGFPEEAITPSIKVTGFGSGESVTISTPMWTTTSYSCTTGSSVGAYGTCTTGTATVVADTNGGSKTITATGGTSGLTAATTYTVNPWAAFYNSATGSTSYSFLGSAPTSVLIEAHGLAAGTIAASSITIGGVATSHSSVTVGSSGAFAGAGGQLVVAPTSQVPFGSVSAVIGGVTFNYASGNIALGASTWGGALISSIVGSTSSTGVVTSDATSYMPGTGFPVSTTSPAPAQNQVAFFGYGFVLAGGAIAVGTGGSGLGTVTPQGTAQCTSTCDANGAFFGIGTLGDTAWSTSGAPTTPASYTAAVTQSSGPANVLSPSFGITSWIVQQSSYLSGSPVDYTSTLQVTAHGFSNTETLTASVGGTAITGGTCTTSTAGTCTTASGTVPDLASGVQSVSVAGSLSGHSVTASTTATGAVTYKPIADFASGQTLSINQGGAGQTTIVRTGNGYGIHGLAANTAYYIIWNAISGSVIVGTFTSTATGGIPIPGVQFSIPSDSSGIHILDIQTPSGATALYGGQVHTETIPSESPFSGAYTTAYGDMLFKNVALLSAAPSVAVIGAAETLSGSGLASGASYVIALGNGAGTVSTSAAALATFTSTSAGAVPGGVTITLTDTPTTYETGTVNYFSIQTAGHFGVSTSSDAYAQFVLAASATLNMTSAPNGHPVTLTAHALNTGGVYNIVFNYVQSPIQSTSYTGTTVGVIAPNSVGAGSATFNVPATAPSGTFVVQLTVATQGGSGAPVGTAVLDAPLSLTVGSVSTSSCNTTSCMAGGPSTTTTVGPNKAVQTSFTNNSNAPVTAIVYAVVHNALGQTVAYSTATITANPGNSATAYNVLFGLAPGTYSVTIFATSTSGTAISTTSTVSVTIA